jgi:phosphate transport system substrate-binding protein
MHARSLAAVAAVVMAAGAHAQVVKVDAGIPAYQRGQAVSGNLNSVGSDTMNNLLTYWAEGFAKSHPTVKVQIEGKGSSTAPTALLAGTAQLGPMSREMKDSEMESIEAKFGYPPIQISAALDVLAVYVHKDNPVASLSLPEVDAIFSKSRKGGFPNELTLWGQLGLKGEWAKKPMSLYGRNSASGTYGFFKDHALFKGDFKDTVKEQPGSASVVQGVSSDLAGIGYSGIGYRTSGVRALPLAATVKGQAYEPSYENALAKTYPLSRYLYIYVVRDPRTPMDALTREFLRFVLSREGQEIVVKDGFLPLPAAVAAEELKKLD